MPAELDRTSEHHHVLRFILKKTRFSLCLRVFVVTTASAVKFQLALSTIIAIPCPPPMHAVANPYFLFRLRNS